MDALAPYQYDLPPELIATSAVYPRTSARLLVVHCRTGELIDATFAQLSSFLAPGDQLVLNNAKVCKARLILSKTTGAKVECFFLDQAVEANQSEFAVLWGNSRRLKPADILAPWGQQSNFFTVEVVATEREGAIARFYRDGRLILGSAVYGFLEEIGRMPLPPYIAQDPSDRQIEDYQNPLGTHDGSVAAPTATLHFDQEILRDLNHHHGIASGFIHLQVGWGTFAPLTEEALAKGELHEESYEIPPDIAAVVGKKPILPVGTTSLRALETFYRTGISAGSTKIFLHPQNPPTLNIKGLITNFHLPGSSLLMLVASITGIPLLQKAYQHALQQRYRFYSLGDGMLILR